MVKKRKCGTEASLKLRPDSYLWEMTVRKYLNLGEGTWGDMRSAMKLEESAASVYFIRFFSQ